MRASAAISWGLVEYRPWRPAGAKVRGRLSPVSTRVRGRPPAHLHTAKRPAAAPTTRGRGARLWCVILLLVSVQSEVMKDWMAVAAAPRAHSSKGNGRVWTSHRAAEPKAA